MRYLMVLVLSLTMSSAWTVETTALETDPVAELIALFGADGNATRGAWIAGYHGGVATQYKENADRPPTIHIVLTAADQAAVVNFNGHEPLDLADAQRDAALVFVAEARLTADAPRAVRFGWCTEADPQLVTKGVTLTPGAAWKRIVLPIIERPVGLIARGWVVSLDGAGTLDLRAVVLGSRRDVALDPVARDMLHHAPRITLTGQAVTTANIVIDITDATNSHPILQRTIPVRDGTFTCSFTANEFPAFSDCVATARVPGRSDVAATAMPRGFYAFPERSGAHLPSLERRDNLLVAEGKPFGFTGINYTHLAMYHARQSNPEEALREIGQMTAWGMRAVRVTLNWGMIQPAEGVFPGDPQWLATIRAHGLNEHWVDDLDEFVSVAGEHGLRTMIDLHESPTDPYRYFTGNDPANKPGGNPGTGLGWLAPTTSAGCEFDVAVPRHRAALLGTWRWLATHFRGDGNILAFEPPYNEPHEHFVASEENWSALTSACTMVIKQIDPTRLAFAMVGGWGHDNASWSYSWLPPYGIDGLAPHHYLANGPVALRPDAPKFDAPWNAREADASFAYALPSVFLASGVQRQPVLNGEGGDWAAHILLPGMDLHTARQHMYDATLAQCYAAGVSGHLNWRVTHDVEGYDLSIFAHAKRFAPVFAEGPLDWSHASVAIIQNVAAAPIENGHNFSCVPFAEAALALHLGPVHYLTDDEIIYHGIVRESKGLEQVNEASATLNGYQAVLVDPRNLDARVAQVLASSHIPQLVIADPAHLDLAVVSAFLKTHGVTVDQQTPADLQVAVGPKHLVLFCRRGPGGMVRIHTPLTLSGSFRLIAEDGQVIFRGTAADLVTHGAEINVPRWSSAILRIVPGSR